MSAFDRQGADDIHLRLSVRGSEESVDLFHQYMAWVDGDWPWNQVKSTYKECKTCGGALYERPRLAPQDIKLMAKVANVSVKIKRMCYENKCLGDAPISRDFEVKPNPLFAFGHTSSNLVDVVNNHLSREDFAGDEELVLGGY